MIRNGVVLLVGKGNHVCLVNMGKAPITHKRLKVFDVNHGKIEWFLAFITALMIIISITLLVKL